MSIESDTILFNRLEGLDGGSVPSVTGPPLVEQGSVAFGPGRFGNGAIAIANSDFLNITGSFLDPNTIMEDVWLKSNYSVINGQSQSGTNHTIWQWNGPTTSHLIQCAVTTAGTRLFVRVSGASVSFNCTHAAMTWGAGDLVWFLVAYKRAGIEGGADTVRMWFAPKGGAATLVLSSAVVPGNQVNPGIELAVLNNGLAGVATQNGLLDNLKFYSDTDNISDAVDGREFEGYTPVPPLNIVSPLQLEERETFGRSIMVGGIDIFRYGYALDFPDVEWSRSLDDDHLFMGQIKIKCRNLDRFFSPGNAVSPFNGTDMYKMSVSVTNRDLIKIFDGQLAGKPERDESDFSATLLAINPLYTDRYSRQVYASAAAENGAEAVENILTAAGLKNLIDKPSFERSKAVLDANSVQMQVAVTADDDKNLISLIELIGKYSNADVYGFRGKIFFQVWEPTSDRIVSKTIDANEKGLVEGLKISHPDKFLVNDYNIHFLGDSGIAADDESGSNIGALSRTRNTVHSLKNVNEATLIVLENQASAEWVGEQHIRRSHVNLAVKPEAREKITFGIIREEAGHLDLTTLFNFPYIPEGWTDKRFEIHGLIERDKTDVYGITAYELAS